MNHTEFFRQMADGTLAPVYLFTGCEHYVMNSALKKLKSTVVDEATEAVNYTELPSSADGAAIAEAAEAFPFMAEKRMVVVRDSQYLDKNKAEGEERLEAYLGQPSPDTVLVFVSPEPDKRKKIYKLLQKAAVVEFSELSERELAGWIRKTLRASELTVGDAALSFLTEYADGRPEALETELEKLAAYKQSGEVTREDILAIVTPSADYNVFKMTDAIVARDRQTALALLSRTLLAREEPIYLLGAIARQYRILLKMKLLLNKKTPRGEILSALALRDFLYTRYEAVCRKMTEEQLSRAVTLCLETDTGLKTGKAFPETALHTLVTELCRL